jgi:hypothetical protein
MLSNAVFMLRNDFSECMREDEGVEALVGAVALDSTLSPLSSTPAEALARPSKPDMAVAVP